MSLMILWYFIGNSLSLHTVNCTNYCSILIFFQLETLIVNNSVSFISKIIMYTTNGSSSSFSSNTIEWNWQKMYNVKVQVTCIQSILIKILHSSNHPAEKNMLLVMAIKRDRSFFLLATTKCIVWHYGNTLK